MPAHWPAGGCAPGNFAAAYPQIGTPVRSLSSPTGSGQSGYHFEFGHQRHLCGSGSSFHSQLPATPSPNAPTCGSGSPFPQMPPTHSPSVDRMTSQQQQWQQQQQQQWQQQQWQQQQWQQQQWQQQQQLQQQPQQQLQQQQQQLQRPMQPPVQSPMPPAPVQPQQQQPPSTSPQSQPSSSQKGMAVQPQQQQPSLTSPQSQPSSSQKRQFDGNGVRQDAANSGSRKKPCVGGTPPAPKSAAPFYSERWERQVRHAQDVYADHANRLPASIPSDYAAIRGPLAMMGDHLISKVREFAVNPDVGGGSWPVKCARTRPADRNHAEKKEFTCQYVDAEGKKTCTWTLGFEQSESGWCLIGCHANHTHELNASVVSSMVTANGRVIPPEYEELGSLLGEAGQSASSILHVFGTKARRENTPVMWTYKDIYNAFKRTGVCTMDASGYIELLVNRRETSEFTDGDGLRYFAQCDTEGRLARVFVELKNAKAVWGSNLPSRADVENVLILDSTHGTNRYGLKMSLLACVGSDGQTKILAYCLHHEETIVDLTWALRCFDEVFLIPPQSIWTDSGLGMIGAAEKMIATLWPDTEHFLCVFHLDQNFYDNVHPLFCNNSEGWSEVHSQFWRMCKNTEYEMIKSMNRSKDLLLETVQKKGKGPSKDKAVEWLNDVLFARITKWAGAYTAMCFTANTHTTGRDECMNRHVKEIVAAKSSLIELHEGIETYTDMNDHRNAVAVETRLHKQLKQIPAYPSWITELTNALTPYAADVVKAQYALSHVYEVTPKPDWDKATDTPPGTNFRVVLRGDASDGPRSSHLKDMTFPAPSYYADGRRKLDLNVCDFALDDSYNARWKTVSAEKRFIVCHHVTHSWCSCQFSTAMGLPCKHIMASCTRGLNAEAAGFAPSLLSLCSTRWLREFAYSATTSSALPVVTACARGCRETLATQLFRPVAIDHPVAMKECYGKTIMIKWRTKWHLAELQKSTKTQANIELKANQHQNSVVTLNFKYSDQSTPTLPLQYCNYVGVRSLHDGQNLPKMSWFFVEIAPLNDDSLAERARNSEVLNPAGELKPGNRRTRRFKKRFGPMSG